MTAPLTPPDLLLKYYLSHILISQHDNRKTCIQLMKFKVYNRKLLDTYIVYTTPYEPRTDPILLFFHTLADPHPRMKGCGSARV